MTDNQLLRDAFEKHTREVEARKAIEGYDVEHDLRKKPNGKYVEERIAAACIGFIASINHILSQLDTPEMLEAISRGIAASIYHSEGLETMSYAGVEDYCNREWPHYTAQAQAAIEAIKKAVV